MGKERRMGISVEAGGVLCSYDKFSSYLLSKKIGNWGEAEQERVRILKILKGDYHE